MTFAQPLLGAALALAIFFSSLQLLKRALVVLHPWARPFLSRAVGSPLRGAAAGLLVTAAIQSSSATNSVAVGLVAAGALRLEEALAVILGANVGTTLTGQLVAYGSSDLGAPLIALGLLLRALRRPAARAAGEAAAAVGGLFFALGALGQALSLLGDGAASRWLAAALESDLKAAAAGLGLTAVLQSSSAVTGLLIGLAEAGAVPPRAAIAACLGSNVGTVTTTLLAGLPGGPLARRAALYDLAFNALGAALLLPFVSHLAAGTAAIAASAGRQVAHAHTLFNAATVLLALPFVRPVGRWLEAGAGKAGR